MTSTEHDTKNGDISVKAFGPAYVERLGNRFTIVQPACPLRGRSEKKWTVNVVDFTPLAFSYEHSEQALALMERMCVHLLLSSCSRATH